jgi:hypothetical protein
LLYTGGNIYFAGKAKKLKTPHTQIKTVKPYSDGLGIIRDGTPAKPQTFVTGDGWFLYNVVANFAMPQDQKP